MDDCQKSCHSCSNICSNVCPSCMTKGKLVNIKTAYNLVKDPTYLIDDNKTYICCNRKCSVVYYQSGNPYVYDTDDLKVKVWFKSQYKDYIVCYCHNITLNDITNIIKETNLNEVDAKLINKEYIFKLLNINHLEDNCLYNNPIGESCELVFDNAIKFAIKQKENE